MSVAAPASSVSSVSSVSATGRFSEYAESGPALLGVPNSHIIGTFRLFNTNHIIANVLRRCILTRVRTVGFKVDLTSTSDPGITIRKNTSVIFNEMLAHRISLLPVAVRDVDNFVPSNYQCVLQVKHDAKGPIQEDSMLHVTAGDFRILGKQEDGSFQDLGLPAASAMFPPDPITKQTSLLVSLRPQWNQDQPPEEVDLTAYPCIGTGQEHIGFSPVSQCSFKNTLDTNVARREEFFKEWLQNNKKVGTGAEGPTPEQTAQYRREWETLDIQRCFLVDANGEPNSFDFTVESVGVLSVPHIVLEGLRAAIQLVAPYTDITKSLLDLQITMKPAETRMENGVDILFEGQDHTLGTLFQSILASSLDGVGSGDKPIVSVGYKVPHPLHKSMLLRVGFRKGVEPTEEIVRDIVTSVATKSQSIFQSLLANWQQLTSLVSSSSEA